MEQIATYSSNKHAEFTHCVNIPWVLGSDKPNPWNEICSWAIEVYGLPGESFITDFTDKYLVFKFRNEQDAVHFSLVWE